MCNANSEKGKKGGGVKEIKKGKRKKEKGRKEEEGKRRRREKIGRWMEGGGGQWSV